MSIVFPIYSSILSIHYDHDSFFFFFLLFIFVKFKKQKRKSWSFAPLALSLFTFYLFLLPPALFDGGAPTVQLNSSSPILPASSVALTVTSWVVLLSLS